jgi:hypothetical protein
MFIKKSIWLRISNVSNIFHVVWWIYCWVDCIIFWYIWSEMINRLIGADLIFKLIKIVLCKWVDIVHKQTINKKTINEMNWY